MDARFGFGPATAAWFAESFAAPTRVQREGWPIIAGGGHALLLAPTGSGKTLASFLSCIDALTRREEAGGTAVLYVSPLKALVYDIERNLRAPIAGVKRTADRLGIPIRVPAVDVRTGDTPQDVRRKQAREPADILVTTPESLYLLLTQDARKNLKSVRTVIVDEIHVMASTKRGAHLALSLERLAELTGEDPQRIGLSATQRPLETVARFLGGARPVSIVDASEPPRLTVRITVPVEDMERPPPVAEPKGGPTMHPQPVEHGIWPRVYPELLSLIRAHRSTIVFTNSRLLCERIAQKLNELAGEELVRAHHGSISHRKRSEIEELLKSGQLPALVATSSLELGIDMGAVDQVILVESPGSVARGLQRVGRAGHGVGETSEGHLFPKYRGDLLECAVVAEHMLRGEIEATSMPTNCVDVLAQQIVAMVAMEDLRVEDLERVLRRAAPYAELSREALHNVLDMLSGRFPSDEFADLTPRINWDRSTDVLSARRSARILAVMNAGTIPDRGLFRVQLGPDGPRLGELDEEMVYETRQGDTILLGASAWRVDGIERDRVLVTPAPGQPGRLPFWRGERPGRPIELGRAMGRFVAEWDAVRPAEREAWLEARTVLDPFARKNLTAYLEEQKEQNGVLPTDTAITVERFKDEIGDWRICILSPFGNRVHAPWALALEAELSARAGFEVDVLYGNDGISLRLVDTGELPEIQQLFPEPDTVEDAVLEQLGHSALFAARFRENAGRALLLPKRFTRGRTPLWLQRRKSEALLSVARRFPDFPIVLETYRECLRDVFDLPSLRTLLEGVRARTIRVDEVETRSCSPFARTLVYQYVAANLYEYDAPVAERRAAALSLDRRLLADLLGQEELRGLLDAEAVAEVERELQWLDERFVTSPDHVHDMLRRLGDLSLAELELRGARTEWVEALGRDKRAVHVRVAGEPRWIAVEDAARYRDALGVALPPGLPAVFLALAERPLETLVARYARTHGPFTVEAVAARFGVVPAMIRIVLEGLEARGVVLRGEIRPGGRGEEWCDEEVLKRLKRRSLAKLRHEIAPVEPEVLARFLLAWHEVPPRRRARALDVVLDQLEGLALPFSTLETEVLPARMPEFSPRMLDELGASGQLVWIGRGAVGLKDGKIALYRRERAALLCDVGDPTALSSEARRVLGELEARGASFFVELQRRVGLTTKDLLATLWELVWAGFVTNDTFAPLRGLGAKSSRRADASTRQIGGRWGAVSQLLGPPPHPTERLHARVAALLERYGVVGREAASAAEIEGGYAAMYPVLRAMEEAGKIRRGHFVEGLGGAQFALPGAVDRLRDARRASGEAHVLAATDPANAYGAVLPWPETAGEARPRRVPGADVVLVDGRPALFVEQGAKSLITFTAGEDGAEVLKLAVSALLAHRRGRALVVRKVDGVEAERSAAAGALKDAGFQRDYRGLSLG